MKNPIHRLFILSVNLLLAAASGAVALGQAEPQAQPQQNQASSESQAQPAQVITGLEAEGELKAVDTNRKIFLITSGENMDELLFHYDDQTEVLDQSEGVEGLAGQSQTWVRIGYRAEGAQAIAETIEILDSGSSEDASESGMQEPL